MGKCYFFISLLTLLLLLLLLLLFCLGGHTQQYSLLLTLCSANLKDSMGCQGSNVHQLLERPYPLCYTSSLSLINFERYHTKTLSIFFYSFFKTKFCSLFKHIRKLFPLLLHWSLKCWNKFSAKRRHNFKMYCLREKTDQGRILFLHQTIKHDQVSYLLIHTTN